MCSNHIIDNRPTVDATPSGRLMVTRLEPSKVFKLLADHQSIAPCASHCMSPSLTGPCVSRFAPLPRGLRLEVASTECQAHNSQGAKNNENNVLQRVIDLLGSCIGHGNFPSCTWAGFGCQNRRSLSFPAFLTDHPLLYVRPAIEELDTSFLAGIQKSNDLDVPERHSVEVQQNPGLSAFKLRFQFIQM